MKRVLSSVLAVVMVALLFCGCQDQDVDVASIASESENSEQQLSSTSSYQLPYLEHTSDDIKAIMEKGKLTVAVVNSFSDPPLMRKDENGQYSGIEYKMAKALAESLGVELEINDTSATYNALIETIIHEQADVIICNFTLTPNRAKTILFTDSYMDSNISIMLNKEQTILNNIEINPLDYLKSNSVKLGALRGTYYTDFIREKFPNAQLVEMDSEDALVDAVVSGEIMGYVSDELEFIMQLVSKPEYDFYTSTYRFTDMEEKICMAVPLAKDDLKEYLNSFINFYGKITNHDIEDECKEYYHYYD